MVKKLLHLVVPIVLPFVLYGVYAWLTRRGVRAAGKAGGSTRAGVPWYWLGVSATGLLIVSLVALALLSGEDPGGTYLPPRMIDGAIAPAEVR